MDDSQASREIKKKIELDSFMPKQRTNANGVIPYQLHQLELDKIIENQSKYYPFLKEINPVSSHLKEAPYKLDELIRFRVPYYVGPLISPNESTKDIQTKKNQNFAWMIRKEEGQITPWNFDQKVDRIESANKFIKRMTTKDTYLFGEDVLPANSLLYQKFMVLNELNNIRINGKRISVDLKQEIYENLFKKHTTVTVKKLENYLKENLNLVKVEIKGLADEKKFNSGLTTYNRFKNLNIFDNQIDDLKYRNDFEKIIEWSTIFEDKSIYKEKLRSIDWLNEKQINALSNIRLQGWGRLSKKLLAQLHDHNGQTIIEQLWDSQNNFMQIVTQADFKDAIAKAGGLLENADTDYLNLSKRLKDEMVILVYTREEIEAFEKGESMELPIETCVCPEITNDGCLKEEEVVSNKPDESVAEGEEEPHVISILTATKEEWMLLPGIGETKAEAIIQYRDEHGFQSIEDVKKVSGIGDSTFEKIKEYLTM